jgi:hypothetical protein
MARTVASRSYDTRRKPSLTTLQRVQHGIERRKIAINVRDECDGQAHGCVIPVQTDDLALRYHGDVNPLPAKLDLMI